MKRYLVAAAIVGGAVLGLAQPSAAGVSDTFRFEFYAAAPDLQIGTDTYTHHSDFRHYGDYYRNRGYRDPENNVSCRETTARDATGKTFRRITCRGREGTTGVPVR